MRTGVTVWFTGLSGAGKTTIAMRVERLLRDRGVRAERLDGDVVRQSLTRDLGFSKEDRDKNIERVTFVAKVLTRNDVIVLSSFISPYSAQREAARREIGAFLEVYVRAPLDVLVARDLKGLYRKALAGELQGFTGVNDPYEAPEHPDLVCDTDRESVDESVAKVMALLEAAGHLPVGEGAAHAAPAPARAPHTRPPGPSVPHGGVLVDRELAGDARDRARERAAGLPRVALDERELSDVEMLGVGALSPLTGFMGRSDYESVVESMRLSDGLVWALPVTLAVSEERAAAIGDGEEVALTDADGRAVALMRVTDRFGYDREREAERCFGTTDAAHPGVARVYGQGAVYLGGPVWVIDRPNGDAFPEHRLTPRQTRERFDALGWKSVVGFQTRNPVHRAHEYLHKCAMEMVDGLLLHPLVGATKSDDVPADVRMRTYEAILADYYPPGRVLLSVFPAAMRYAGPREAVWHALCRKNYGCTHFIVGRDHAGVGSYYGSYDAQQLIDRFTPEELGITALNFEHAFYCRTCGNMATAKTCPHGAEHHLQLSGTRVRAMLAADELPPPEFTRPEVARILGAAYNGAPAGARPDPPSNGR